VSLIPRTRRQFLVSSASAALAGLLPAPGRGADQPPLERRQPLGLRAACSSLAFSDLKWEEALEQIKRLGFRYAELAMFEGVAHVNPSTLNDPDAHAKKIAAVCGRLEVEPIAIHANFVLGDPHQFPGLTTPDAAARKAILAQFERVVVCARAAEIPLIHIFPGRLIDSVGADACLKNACDLLTQMHALVARRGLILAIKNQSGSIAQDPADAQMILDKVPGLRLNYDLSHVVACQYSVEQTQALMKSVAHVSIRNAKPGNYCVSLDEGELSYSVRPFFDCLRQQRVNAYVSVEYLTPEFRSNIPRLRAILQREDIATS
jgi:sugar phosphate isomerase/epimerase